WLSRGAITMEVKEHYKMYKDGKRWVFAAITVAAIGLGTAVSQDIEAHADTTSGSTPVQNSESSAKPSTTVVLTSSTGSQTTETTTTGSAGNGTTGTGNSSTGNQADTTTGTLTGSQQDTSSQGTDSDTTT